MSGLKKKVMALITAAVMLTASLPLNIQAVFGATTTYGVFTVTTNVSGGVSYRNSVLTISKEGEYTISGTSTSDRVEVTASSGEVVITFDGLSITSGTIPFNITGNIMGSADVTIKLRGENTLTSTFSGNSAGYAGLQKTNTSSNLTITSASGDGSTDGSLNATGGYNGAGIGGGYYGSGSGVRITGGTVTAAGGRNGAGIGGGYSGSGSDITITGGRVTATGGSYGAGIGGGFDGAGSNITITGGTVTATGGSYGAGIGGGFYGSGSDITIAGGYVDASGGSNASAIGGGYSGSRSGINITGGYFKEGDTNKDTVYGISVNNVCEVRESGNTNYPYLVQIKEEYLNNVPEQDADGTYSINTAEELEWFAAMVLTGQNDIDGKLMNDINFVSYSSMIGTDICPYKGTFDGGGHTVTVSYDTSSQYTALFRYIDGAAIKNLNTSGSITTSAKFAAGIAGLNTGSAATISSCTSDVTINSTVSGDGTHGGIIANSNQATAIENCAFTGSFGGSSTTCWGGIAGWLDNSGAKVSNSYVALESNTGSTEGSSTIARGNGSVENCYYLAAIGTAQGAQKSEEAFASGEVCYLLNGSPSENAVWGQTIGEDTYPVIGGARVYGIETGNCDNPVLTYTNNKDEAGNYVIHPLGDNGICACGESYGEPEHDNSVYLIGNAGNLIWFANEVNSGNTNISGRLTADIDLENYQYMIGTSENPYKGTFDGNGHTVTVNYDSGSQYTALFQYIDGAAIKNLNTTGNITTSAKFAAGIAGYNTGSAATISGCTSDVTINSSVNGDGTHGGIIANSDQATVIENCAFTGSFEGSSTDSWGGIAGWLDNSDAKVLNSYVALKINTGSTEGSSTIAGGKVSVENCYYLAAIGTVQGEQKTAEQFASGEVCYLLNGSSSENAVWGQKLGTDAYPVISDDIVYGGYIGTDCSDMTEGYTNDADELIDKIEHNIGDNGICSVCGKYYDEPESTDGVYQIENAGNLMWFAELVNSSDNKNINAVLTADIDMEGIAGFVPIGIVSSFDAEGSNEAGYTGTFDGQGYTISNLAITDTGYVTAGLFGNVSGTVKNIGLDNVSFKKTGSADGRYGVLCGLILEGGTVENCYVINSSVDATTSRVAGIIAGGNYGGTVKNCYTKNCSFTAYQQRGGYIVGDNINDNNSATGTVENCYTDGSNITGSKSGNVTGGRNSVSDDSFTMGEVCYLLNGSSSENTVWGQTIGKDNYPVIGGDTVYEKYFGNCTDYTIKYTNNANEGADQPLHGTIENGICTDCHAYFEKPEYDEESGVYLIGNAGNLIWFANMVNSGQTSINGKLTADIDLEDYQYMIGTSENPYSGTFDGDGHTVKVNYNTSEQGTALFRYVGGAVIKNLNTTGNITTSGKRAAGIVSSNDSGEGATISGCTSDITINSTVNGDGTHGGIIGNSDRATVIENCAFTGSFEGSSTNRWGGIAGWLNRDSASVSNSYVALNNFGGSTASSSTIARGYGSVDNCYYLTAIGTAQGTQKLKEAFANGEVCYLLNGSSNEGIWHQTIGEDAYPVLSSESKAVIGFVNLDNESEYGNTVDDGSVVIEESSDGISMFEVVVNTSKYGGENALYLDSVSVLINDSEVHMITNYTESDDDVSVILPVNIEGNTEETATLRALITAYANADDVESRSNPLYYISEALTYSF